MGRESIVVKSGRRIAVLAMCIPLHALADGSYPSYSAQTIVNAATQTAEALAPNTIATIYGSNLSFNTASAGGSNQTGAVLPLSLGGVNVLVGGFTANLFYVSPTQINFLIPYELTAGPMTVAVVRQGLAGPVVPIQLNATSPGLFPWNGDYAIAEHLNGSLVCTASPASAGETVVLYAVGLGRVTPDTTSGEIVHSTATIRATPFQVLLNGTAIPAPNVLYAGLAPGFAGLYQINVKLPDPLPQNPQIVLSAAGAASAPFIQLATETPGPAGN